MRTGKIGTIRFGDIAVSGPRDFVGHVVVCRAPNNYFDLELILSLVEAYRFLAADRECRAIVLSSQGKHFCAGANLRSAEVDVDIAAQAREFYRAAIQLIEVEIPVVAAVQGGAIGGGLGVACTADFRVATPDSYFSANFARVGLHHGFGLSATLPAIVGPQRALELLYIGKRVLGPQAADMGLCDRLAPAEQLLVEASTLAAEIAASAPLAVRSIRATMRRELIEAFGKAVEREAQEQAPLLLTQDWKEGVEANAEHREPVFRRC